jgi:hypothetical protein
VSRESGSGKTFSSLHLLKPNDIGVYLTARDFGDWNEDDFVGVDSGAAVDKDARNAKAQEVLIAVLKRLLTQEIIDAMRCPSNAGEGKMPTRLVIVIDEVGKKLQLVRALCILATEQLIGLQLGVRTELVAIGTGIDCNLAAPGSHPTTYRIVRLPSKGQVWHQILSMASSKNVNVKFLELLGKDLALAQNSRVAAIAYEQATNFSAALMQNAVDRPRCARLVVPTFLTQVVVDFKGRNGMNPVVLGDILKDYARCANVVLYGQADKDSVLRLARDCATVDLVGVKGVLTDNAFWAATGCNEKNFPKHRELQVVNGQKLLAPYDPVRQVFARFAMSTAQLELFRLHYGFNMSLEGWEGHELAAMQYLEFLLVGARGVAVDRVLRLLDVSAPSQQRNPRGNDNTGGNSNAMQSKAKLNHKAVRVMHSDQAIAPLFDSCKNLHCQNTLDRISQHLLEDEVVIVRNAAKAPFADILVFLPNVGVLLVQNKFYGDATMFTSTDAHIELARMGAFCDSTTLSRGEVENIVSVLPWDVVQDHAPGFVSSEPRKSGRAPSVKRKLIAETYFANDNKLPGALKKYIMTVAESDRADLKALHVQLRKCCAGLTGGDKSPGPSSCALWVKFCLMTTKPRVALDLPGVLQFQATPETMSPVKMPNDSASSQKGFDGVTLLV